MAAGRQGADRQTAYIRGIYAYGITDRARPDHRRITDAAARAGAGMMAMRKHGKHHIHGLPVVAFPARMAARRDRVARVVVAASDLQPPIQRLQQLMLTADVRAWAAMLTAAAPVDPAAAAMLTMAATAAADLALLRGAALDLVDALPADRAHRAMLLADVAWMDRAARRMMAVAAKVGR